MAHPDGLVKQDLTALRGVEHRAADVILRDGCPVEIDRLAKGGIPRGGSRLRGKLNGKGEAGGCDQGTAKVAHALNSNRTAMFQLFRRTS